MCVRKVISSECLICKEVVGNKVVQRKYKLARNYVLAAAIGLWAARQEVSPARSLPQAADRAELATIGASPARSV